MQPVWIIDPALNLSEIPYHRRRSAPHSYGTPIDLDFDHRYSCEDHPQCSTPVLKSQSLPIFPAGKDPVLLLQNRRYYRRYRRRGSSSSTASQEPFYATFPSTRIVTPNCLLRPLCGHPDIPRGPNDGPARRPRRNPCPTPSTAPPCGPDTEQSKSPRRSDEGSFPGKYPKRGVTPKKHGALAPTPVQPSPLTTFRAA